MMRPGALLLAAALLMTAVSGGVVAREMSRVGVHQGYAPVQPIAFSHKLHAGDSQIPCLYCHFGARTSRHAGIPPLNVCMNCHSILTKQTVEIEKLKEAVQRGQPIAWTKVHNLPDFVYFSHSQHVTGGVACTACHGPVETMARVRTHRSPWAGASIATRSGGPICCGLVKRRSSEGILARRFPDSIVASATTDGTAAGQRNQTKGSP